MKIEVVVKDLEKALKNVKYGLGDRRLNSMIKDGVHLAYDDYTATLEIRTADYIHTASERMPATITGSMTEDGRTATVSYKELLSVLKSIKQKHAMAYFERANVTPGVMYKLTVDNHTWFLSSWHGRQYPPMPLMSDNVVKLALNLEEWRKLAYVAKAAYFDSPRSAMDCISLTWDNGKVQAVATDGYRLHYADVGAVTVTNDIKDDHGRRWLIPAADILAITKLFPKGPGAMLIGITLPLDTLRYSVTYGGEYTGLLSNGYYPDWELAVSKTKTSKYEIVINRSELLEVLTKIVKMSKIAKQSPFAVLRHTSPDNLAVEARFGESDPSSWYVHMLGDEEFPAISINAAQVLEGINGLGCELLRVSFDDRDDRPVFFNPDPEHGSDNSNWFLTMPVLKREGKS